MRQSLVNRVVAAVLAVWVAMLAGDWGALHVCPAHSRSHAAAHADGTPASHRHEHGAPSATHRQCTCLGACCAAPAATLPARCGVLPHAVAISQSDEVPVGTEGVRPLAPRFTVPPALAPPAALRSI